MSHGSARSRRSSQSGRSATRSARIRRAWPTDRSRRALCPESATASAMRWRSVPGLGFEQAGVACVAPPLGRAVRPMAWAIIEATWANRRATPVRLARASGPEASSPLVSTWAPRGRHLRAYHRHGRRAQELRREEPTEATQHLGCQECQFSPADQRGGARARRSVQHSQRVAGPVNGDAGGSAVTRAARRSGVLGPRTRWTVQARNQLPSRAASAGRPSSPK